MDEEAAEGSIVENVDAGAEIEKASGAEGADKGAEGGEGAKEEVKAEEAPALPDSADKYDFTIPADIGLKDEKGEAFQFAADDPFVKEAREAAFKHKIPQAALTELLSIYAKANLGQVEVVTSEAKAAEDARVKSELSKLNFKGSDGKEVDGKQRIDTMLKNVNRVLGDDSASKKISAGLINADVVLVIDRLVGKLLEQPTGKEPAGAETKFEGLRGASLLTAIRAAG